MKNFSRLISRIVDSSFNAVRYNSTAGLKPFNSIPGPRALPFIGNMWRYIPVIGQYDINDLASIARMNKQKYGPLVRLKINDKLTILSLFDPNDVEALFRQDDKYPSRRAFVAMKKYRTERPDRYTDGGIVPENGPNWQRQRSLFQERMLSKSKVSAYAGKIDKETWKTIDELHRLIEMNGKDDKLVNVEKFQKLINRWSLRCMTSLFLNCELHTISEDIVERLLQEIDNTLIGSHGTDILSTKWMTRPDKCKYYQLLVKSQDFLYEFAAAQIDRVIQEGESKRGSMVHDWLFEDNVSRKDVNSFVMDSFLAGIHTTGYTLAHLFHHLSQNKNYQGMLHEEIDSNRLCEKDTLKADDVENMAFLQNCLQETLRLNPVSTGTGRLTANDIEIAGYHIPKGTMIVVENEVISRDTKNFSNPDKFEPLRWKDYRNRPRDQRPSAFACRPFGLGARSCIGQRIIELEMKILICRLLQHFQIDHITQPQRQTYMVHTIKNDLDAKLTIRTQN